MTSLARHALLCAALWIGLNCAAGAQVDIRDVLAAQGDVIAKSSRKTIQPAIDAVATSGATQAQEVLERWQSKSLWRRKSDGAFFYVEDAPDRAVQPIDIVTGAQVGPPVAKRDFKQIKPNSGIRAAIGAALVRFQLLDPDPTRRTEALDAIERDANPSHLNALRGAIDEEPDPDLAARKMRLERLLTIRFDEDSAARIAAIEEFSGDMGLDVRATLNPLVQTEIEILPAGAQRDNERYAGILSPGSDALPRAVAYDLLVENGFAPARLDRAEQRAVLEENLSDGSVGGFEVASLNLQENRDAAFAALVDAGLAEARADDSQINTLLQAHIFAQKYVGSDLAVIAAALTTLASIEQAVAWNQFLDLGLDGLSLASIYFLAAIGLAITFGVMGVINMAHGEFIMMGAYTGYVVQLIIPDYTISILVALPTAFIVTFAAGVAMERSVIRWLRHRPLETLLATFGISIALQQIAKNIFGTQARPLTAPDWLGGALVLNDVVSISYIRIAIFVLALIFLCFFLYLMNRTRLGLEVRAVTQNPRMAASMGIDPDRINMLTFGLGSGIAGIAGVAIGLYAKVTSEMGADYIVQSFMTVVVGGVGNIWGTLLGAGMIGFLQKGIEWLNPSNTLAAQTYMIVFIILFIQFRPKGIIALKGRAAEA